MLLGAATEEVARGEERPHPSTGRWGLDHVPALDGLRGAAVVAVLLFHAGYLDGGYLGVDLFFVLSGYLITSLLLGEHAATGRVDLPAFWARRLRRLLPALLLLLVGAAVYAVVVARPVDLTTIRRDGLATLLYVANWSTILRGTNYWDISLAPSPLQHTWSLAIEEQFYLLWPLLVVAVTRRAAASASHPVRAVRTLCLWLAAASAGLFLVLQGAGVSTTRVYEGTDTRAAALLLGAAWAAHRLLPAGRRLAHHGPVVGKVGVAAAAVLLVAWWGLDGESRLLYRGGLQVCSLLATLVVVAVTTDSPSPLLSRVLSWAPLRWIGLISYGLYLWHWPIYQTLTEPRVGFGGPGLLVVRLAASVGVAALSYKLLEMPIRRGALRGWIARTSIPVATIGAAAVLVVATIGAVSPAVDVAVAPTGAVVPGAPSMVFLGDSVSISVADHAVADPAAFGVNPLNLGWMACSVLVHQETRHVDGNTEAPPTECDEHLVDDVMRAEPDVVVVLFGGMLDLAVRLDGEWTEPCDPAYDAVYAAEFENYLGEFVPSGAQIVVVATPYSDKRTDWLYTEEKNAFVDCMNAGIATAVERTPGAHMLDLNELLCPDGPGPDACRLELDDGPIRYDGIHFDEGRGGRAVATWIVDHALALAGTG